MQYPCWQATEARFPCYTQFQRWAKSQQLLESNPALKLVYCVCVDSGCFCHIWCHDATVASFCCFECIHCSTPALLLGLVSKLLSSELHSIARRFSFLTPVFVCASVLHCVVSGNFSSTKTNDNIPCSPSLALRAASKAILHNEENYWLACDRKEESRTPCNVPYSGLLPKGKTWECQKVSDKQLDVPL